MTEQELIIQGNQASVLMPKLKRYIDEQIAALSGGVASKAYVDEQLADVGTQLATLAERDKDTLFINFNEVSSSERQTILFLEAGGKSMLVFNNSYIPDDGTEPDGDLDSIATGIYEKYHERYPWLEENNVVKKVVDACIVLKPANPDQWPDGFYPPNDTPWLRLGYCINSDGADVIEQHLRSIKRGITDIPGNYGEEVLFRTPDFLNDFILPIDGASKVPVGMNFCLKGWMLLKNS